VPARTVKAHAEWSQRGVRVGRVASIRTVKRMIKEFEETFTWQPKKTASRAGQRVLCSKSLDALSEMLTGDPTLYLSQSVPSFTLGGLVLFHSRCANSDTNWTFSAGRL
jgi:hypothetical protein